MPSKTKMVVRGKNDLPAIPNELIDQFVTGPMSAEAVNDISMAFKRALIERAMNGELSHHLGYGAGEDKPEQASNYRNGSSGKTVLTDTGAVRIEVPRDREGSFEPVLIAKHERRFTGFDDKIVAMYARGMTVRESQGFLMESYGTRDILGLWIENTEGAKFWMKVFNDLKTRGVADILIAVTDGLKGMGEALQAVFPATTLQTCIVHLIRNSLEFAGWKERKTLAQALRPIYGGPSVEAAEAELGAFERSALGKKFPTVVACWRRAWDKVIPFFTFPPEVRRVIYTTNAIESVNARLRKIIKTRGHFPSDDAANKLIWLALRNITANWGHPARDWKAAMNQFAIIYADRFMKAAV